MTENLDFSICTFPGCTSQAPGQGYCYAHQAQKRNGYELTPVGENYRKDESLCSVPECENIRWSGGMCRAHYLQSYHGRPIRPVKQHPKVMCNVENCTRHAVTKGYCGSHYNVQVDRTKRICTVAGCDLPHEAKGYCKTHYRQAKLGKVPGEIRDWRKYTEIAKCFIDGCTKAAISKDLCSRHAAQSGSFSLTKERLNDLLAIDHCTVCGSTSRLCIDHDHTCCEGTKSCGKCVRGLLCSNCNTALGYTKDDPVRLRGLADYLEQFHVNYV